MPITMPGQLKKFGGILEKGLTSSLAPFVVQELLAKRLKHETVWSVSKWVEDNVSLWGMFDSKTQEKARRIIRDRVPDINWLTPNWIINAVKKENPSIASLFLGWQKGRNWLERQVKEFKTELRY